MPAYVATRIGDVLNEHGKAVKGARVLVLGIAYKADVGDVRESPALKVMQQLRRRGAKVSYHDPYVAAVDVDGVRVSRAAFTGRSLATADCVAILTPHSEYDLQWIADHARLVFDSRNAYNSDRRANIVRL
jgi:UDP-N-acetyl-D-glucosamine dehydrogenase